MSFREFEYADGKSFKFWKIEQQGGDLVTRYGRIGSAGQETKKNYGSPDAAMKAYDKLVAEKTGKGYVEKSGGGMAAAKPVKAAAATKEEVASAPAPISSLLFSTTRDSNFQHLTNFIGERVTDYKEGKPPKGKGVFRIRCHCEEDEETLEDFTKRFQAFLDSEAALGTIGLVTGLEEMYGESGANAYTILTKNADRLPQLRALFLGDILQEEQEISWIHQSDVSPVLAAFPELEVLRIRGATDLAISKPQHAKLRALAIESGGLSPEVVAQICRGKFPELEYLELWLGTPDYGGDCRVNDLQPILKGKLFPKLTYLGFRNSQIADDIAAVIVKSPIMDQLETLDLSLGNLSDEGANALLQLKDNKKLKRLDLHHHYISKPVQKLLKQLPFPVDLADAKTVDEDDEWSGRFISISE
ncbi:STM4015 family protein [Anatilimnocola sp. NA78]|uniref:STM4015 family protein n=1 Tax=Anatilimnocola sp. NA78 TaxID=3415683 RepID=UPI003CE54FAD